MELTILGSGTSLPTPTRGCPGYALTVDGEPILFDTGSGSVAKLPKAGIELAKVRSIFYSHFHVDHTGDLGPILFARRNPALADAGKLTLYGPPGMKKLLAGLQAAYPGPWLDGSKYGLEVVEVWDRPVELGAVRVTPVPVLHTNSSVAYRVEGRGRTFCYSGDADVCPGLVEAAKDADLFLCECSFPDDQKVEGHLAPTTAGEMAAQAGAKRLLLTHFYPVMETIDPVAPCARAYGGRVELGADLLRTAV